MDSGLICGSGCVLLFLDCPCGPAGAAAPARSAQVTCSAASFRAPGDLWPGSQVLPCSVCAGKDQGAGRGGREPPSASTPHSSVSLLCPTLCNPMDYIACQTPLSTGFSRQEYRCGLPCPPPGDLPNPGIKPFFLKSPALADGFSITSTTWEAQVDSFHSLILAMGL